MSKITSSDYPYADSAATRMLREGIESSGKSQRAISAELGYRTPVMLSHMASGRVAIPHDRSDKIAEVLDLDRLEFAIALMQQSDPELIDLMIQAFSSNAVAAEDSQDFMAELKLLAGGELSSLKAGQKRVLKEVVADPNAERRWLSIHEVPLVESIRRRRPKVRSSGVSEETMHALMNALDR